MDNLQHVAIECLREALEAAEAGEWFHSLKAAELAVKKLQDSLVPEHHQENGHSYYTRPFPSVGEIQTLKTIKEK